MIEWATCIAVVYSITDQDSFTTASALLDEINFYYNSKSSKALGPKCIGLLGNKRDLSHLREVSQKDGKNLATRHGAGFWEVSASEDYHSTHAPLNSMIVESYLNTLTLKSSSKSFNISPLSSLKGHSEGSRTRSETSPNVYSFDSEDDVPLSPAEWGSEKRRSASGFSNNRKKLELKLHESKRAKKNSVGKSPYDNVSAADNNNNNTTADTPTDSEESPVRTSSWSKKDKKRSSTRKSTEKKEGVSSQKGLLRSYSYSDLKTLQMEQTSDGSPQDSNTPDRENAEDHADNDTAADQTTNNNNNNFLSSLDEGQATASFTRLHSYVDQNAEQVKSPRTRRERRKTTAVSVSTDLSESELSPKSPDGMHKFKRAEKKSVRRKISQIFKPKIALEAL